MPNVDAWAKTTNDDRRQALLVVEKQVKPGSC